MARREAVIGNSIVTFERLFSQHAEIDHLLLKDPHETEYVEQIVHGMVREVGEKLVSDLLESHRAVSIIVTLDKHEGLMMNTMIYTLCVWHAVEQEPYVSPELSKELEGLDSASST